MTVLDTNVIIHYLKGVTAVVEKVSAVARRDLAVSTITQFEIEFGLLRSGNHAGRRKLVHGLFEGMERLPFNDKAAEEAAKIRLELSVKGELIGPYDLLIAGTARSIGAVLVTNNMREFSRVKNLRCEDWTRS